jgi:hypothetical protein
MSENPMSEENNTTTPEAPVTLKAAAAAFDCAASSLKNNIKSGKLPAEQETPKSPYIVRLADVERFLRETPGIASRLHPKENPKPESKGPEVESSTEPDPVTTEAPTDPPFHKGAVSKEENVTPSKQEVDNAAANTSVSQSPKPPPKPPLKRRRNRRRGKGGGGAGPPSGVQRDLVLKALDGASPTERLRVIACLNEIATIVASA